MANKEDLTDKEIEELKATKPRSMRSYAKTCSGELPLHTVRKRNLTKTPSRPLRPMKVSI